MPLNQLLLAILENAKISERINEAAEDEDQDAAGSETEEQGQDAGEDAAEDTGTEDNNDAGEDTKNDEEDSDGQDGEENADEGDEFSFDSDEESDDGPNPDGLPDPDATGDDSSSEEEPEEKNVQTNILNLSTLDRHLLKKKILNNFLDLRSQLGSFKNMIDQREGGPMEPEVRDKIINSLGTLYEQLTEYLIYRISYINYEENLQNFALFAARFKEIIEISTIDDKHDNKSDKKKSSSTN